MQAILTRINENCELRNLSEKTRKSYTAYIKQFFNYFSDVKPEKLGTEEIREFLLHLKRDKKLSIPTLDIVYSALKFLYITVFGKSWEISPIPRVKKARKLPVVFSVEEIIKILGVVKNIKHKAIISVMYSAGLRTGEAVALKVNDIDSKRMLIRIENSKGAKDRYTILSKKTLLILREYWKVYKPKYWLFPGKYANEHLSNRAVSGMFKDYKEQAGVTKPASVYCLRHSFATHMLENGTNLFHIQLLMGHSSPKTTTVYLHVRRIDLQKIISPFDLIKKKI